MRKVVAVAVLTGMILHCAGKLGALSYLYKHRHEIAYSLGLTAEKVISICSSSYHFEKEFVASSTDTDPGIPEGLLQPRDINLFVESLNGSPIPQFIFLREIQLIRMIDDVSEPNSGRIFHPPC